MSAGLKPWKPYPAYKDSGVEWLGQVPEGWEIKQVRRVSPILRGASPRPIDDPIYFDDNGLFAWVRIADVTSSEMFLEKTTQQLSELGASLSVKLEPDSLFLSIAGSVGKPCITKIKCCIHDGFVYFPNMNINNKFLFYIFKSGEPYKGLGKMGTQLNLNTDTVGSIKIPVPPLPEQRAIAAFLNQQCAQIDSLIEKKQRMLGLLDEKRRAVITQAVTRGLDPTVPMKDSGVKRLGEVPKGWEVKPLKTAIMFQRGHDLPADHRDDGAYPLVSSSGISGVHSVAVAKGPGIVTGRYGTLGIFYFIDSDYWPLNTTLYSIDIYKNIPKFLYYMLSTLTSLIKLYSIKSAVPGIDRNDLHPTKVVLPPIPEQQAIADYLDAQCATMDSQRKNLGKSIELLREYRASIITHAVTGKIDVRDVAPLQ